MRQIDRAMLFLATILAACFVLIAAHYWKQVDHSERLDLATRRLFIRWIITGLLVPSAFWLVFNLGLLGVPVWPSITPIRAGVSAWWSSFDGPAAAGVFFVSSYWAGVSLVWLLGQLFERIQDKRAFARFCLPWSVVLVPGVILLIYAAQWSVVGIVLMLSGIALVHATLPLTEINPPLPSYARAQARINFGRYDEAEMEVIHELEQHEDDFEGWMMLAELYATHFNDVPSADQTVREICDQPATTPVEVGIALNRLADWHLKIGRDPVSARDALDELCRRLAGTHMERMARQRIAQLPATREALLAQERRPRLRIPSAPDEATRPEALPREEAERQANECVAALTGNPDDVPARERFARLLGDHLGRKPAAIDQIELLLALPGQPDAKRAEWLFTIAGWYGGEDPERARLIYERIVRDHPSTKEAFATQRRLNLLNLQSEFRRRAAAGPGTPLQKERPG